MKPEKEHSKTKMKIFNPLTNQHQEIESDVVESKPIDKEKTEKDLA